MQWLPALNVAVTLLIAILVIGRWVGARDTVAQATTADLERLREDVERRLARKVSLDLYHSERDALQRRVDRLETRMDGVASV